MSTESTQTREDIGADMKALVKHLGDSNQFVADLPKQFNTILLSQAWIAGLIEFGRHTHCLTGKPGPHSESTGPMLVLEEGVEWSGLKKRGHKALRDILAEDNDFPVYAECQRYVQLEGIEPNTQKPYPPGSFQRVKISDAEARKAMRLQLRVTEKGFDHLRG